MNTTDSQTVSESRTDRQSPTGGAVATATSTGAV